MAARIGSLRQTGLCAQPVLQLRRNACRRVGRQAVASAEGDKRVVVITGANTGLGKEAMLALSQKGYQVVAACRSIDRGRAAAQAATGVAPDVMELDLAELASVERFAAAFKEKYGRLDVLLNNAGVMAPPDRQVTKDNFELQLGINHLGHALLTSLLMEPILAAPEARIINVASSAHLFGSMNFDNLQSEGFFGYPALGWAAYGQSKLSNVLFTYELHRRLRRAGITHVDVNAVHPGIVATELPRLLPISTNFWPVLNTFGFILTAEKGAQGHIKLASDPALKGVSGKYFADQTGKAAGGGVHIEERTSPASYDAESAERLWNITNALVGARWGALEGAAANGGGAVVPSSR